VWRKLQNAKYLLLKGFGYRKKEIKMVKAFRSEVTIATVTAFVSFTKLTTKASPNEKMTAAICCLGVKRVNHLSKEELFLHQERLHPEGQH